MTELMCSFRKRQDRFSRPRRHDGEEVVRNGLALTPGQMQKMVESNIPIVPQNLGLTYDEGYTNLNFDPPAEYIRGVDIGELWEMSQSTNKRFKSALKKGMEDGIVTPVKNE